MGSEGLCWPRSTRSAFGREIMEYFHYSPATLLLGVWMMERSSVDKRDPSDGLVRCRGKEVIFKGRKLKSSIFRSK